MSDTQTEPRLDINIAEIMAASKERLVEEIVRSAEVRMKYLIDAALEKLIKDAVTAYFKAEIDRTHRGACLAQKRYFEGDHHLLLQDW